MTVNIMMSADEGNFVISWSKHTVGAFYGSTIASSPYCSAFFYTTDALERVYIIFPNIALVFKSIRACAGWKMDQRLTCTHSLLMGMRAATQSHRQPVKLLEGRTNVIPQLYQSHCWALGFITDQERKTGKQEGDCGHGQWI